MRHSLVPTGLDQAGRILLANGADLGLVAAGRAYQQVWARDSMICGLGLLLLGVDGQAIHRRSLETLREYQSELGKIPHNVGLAGVFDPALIAHGGHVGTGRDGKPGVVDTAHAGCIDDNLWYLIGHYCHWRATGDVDFLRQSWSSIERALLWLRYQDSNGCGLLEAHEASNWADLFSARYNVLYDNVLWKAAWEAAAGMAAALGTEPDVFESAARQVGDKLDTLLWVGPESPKDWALVAEERREWLYPLRKIEAELVERPYYLPFVAFRDYGDRFDTLGNLLAIVFGVADETKANLILDYLQGCGVDQPWPVRAVYPPVNPGEREWREYFRVRNLNIPHHYHNGGAWPFIGGFYVAALVAAGRFDQAEEQLERLALMNRRGRTREWEFNEWFHGQSGEPMGFAGQSWSAAMFIYACRAVERRALPLWGRGPAVADRETARVHVPGQ